MKLAQLSILVSIVSLASVGCNLSGQEDGATQVEFNAMTIEGAAPHAVLFENKSLGTYSKAVWNFGDGCESSSDTPIHIYQQPGDYTVELTLFKGDAIVASHIRENLIRVNPSAALPSAGFSPASTSIYSGMPLQFYDNSFGPISTWTWDFGDGGTSSDRNPVHTYLTAGTYSVGLRVASVDGPSLIVRENLVTVFEAAPPNADFTASPREGRSPVTVFFHNTTSGPATSWHWEFGDGLTSDLPNPVHTYVGDPGATFTVTLTATGPGGTSAESKADYVSLYMYDVPEARFSANPVVGISPLVVTFSNTSVGVVDTWYWDFGDGQTSTLKNPTHTFGGASGLSYTVTLTVSGPGGSDAEIKENFIRITPSPRPPGGMIPLIYLYPTATRTENVRVIIDGYGLKTEPQVPLGREIFWPGCTAHPDGRIDFQGATVDYLLYDVVLEKGVTSHRGWILSRDQDGRILLNGREVGMNGLRDHFRGELAEAGLYANEIDDFLRLCLGPDEWLFFKRPTFTYAIRYFPPDQLEQAMKIVTSGVYDSVVRVQYYVEPVEPGIELLEPVYPKAATGGSALHEWGIVPSGDLLWK